MTVRRVPWGYNLTLWTRTAAVLACLFFLATSFRFGWTRAASDFPNYYTAAALVRKAEPLRNYYDWTWFQREMNYAGVGNFQLGAYVPQTPLAMLPLLPLSSLPIQNAKRIWLCFNAVLLAASLLMLARLTSFALSQIVLLAFLGFGTLHANFLLGQYYVLILFLMTAALYFLERAPVASGLLLAITFALKLYGAPYLIYLCVRRRWRAAAAMAAGIVLSIVLAVAIFGFGDIYNFAAHILPRSLEGETIDPYSSLNGTLCTLLRRLFVGEPELNPHPLWNAPAVFFFLRPALTALLLLAPLLAIAKSKDEHRSFAWFSLAVILVSPNAGVYTYLLLLLPVALLLKDARLELRILLIGCWILLTIPLRPAWSSFFPKVWLLLALFLVVGFPLWKSIRPAPGLALALGVMLFAAISAHRRLTAYLEEPAARWEQIAIEPGRIYASSPAVLQAGLVYQAMDKDRYVLRWLHSGHTDEFRFNGQAFGPVAESFTGPVRFELAANRTSTFAVLDLSSRRIVSKGTAPPRDLSAHPSSDGRWLASTISSSGNKQIWITDRMTQARIRLTGGNCDSWDPAWEPDSKAILFASDCNRGIGCPALFRARLASGAETRGQFNSILYGRDPIAVTEQP